MKEKKPIVATVWCAKCFRSHEMNLTIAPTTVDGRKVKPGKEVMLPLMRERSFDFDEPSKPILNKPTYIAIIEKLYVGRDGLLWVKNCGFCFETKTDKKRRLRLEPL